MSEIVAGDMVTVPDGHGHSPSGKAYEVLTIDDYGYATLMSGAWKMKVPVTKCVKVPQIEPPNVHCGGPYIARSEYNRQGELLKKTGEALVKVEKERDDAKKWFDKTVDEIAQVRASLNHVESQRDALLKERDNIQRDVEILKKIISDTKAERDSLQADKDHLLNENTMLQRAFKFPLPPRPALKAPSPPAWLRKGWWYAMNADGRWFVFMNQPSRTDSGWKAGGYASLPAAYQPGVPVERWREACWQVME